MKNIFKALRLALSLLILLGTFVGSGLSLAEAASSGDDEAVETEGSSQDYDVVIVGGGAAGLSAAIEAAEAGVTVALLEKLPFLGGSTLLSGGIVYATGSDIQAEAEVEDSVEDLVEYWIERADGMNDENFIQFVAERSGETINWLVDLGVEFPNLTPAGTSPVLRAHSTADGGAGLIQPLEAHAESLGVEIFKETAAEELLTNEEEEVVGVRAVDSEENEIIFNSSAVVLASGGFDRNPELVAEYAPIAEGHTTFAGVGNTGDGLTMAVELGAEITGNGGVIGFKNVDGESYGSDISSLVWMPFLIVNSEGQRFVNEATDYPLFYEALTQQEDQVSYVIFDANTYVETLDTAVEKDAAVTAESLEELAEQAGINVENLTETIENYNSMIEAGEDTEFGKDLTDHQPIDTPQYYAVKVVPAILGTMSGIMTNLDTQVIQESGDAIPGLYAAGEVANGMFFNEVYPASGTSIQMSFTLGRVAGQNAAEFSQQGQE